MAGASEKALAYRTVDIFAGITGRKLFLKNGPTAKTNGWVIEVPMEDPNMYTLVEHEISHPLFGSDPSAKILFVEGYAKKVASVAHKRGVELDERRLRGALNFIVGVLEDERVISLWGLIYEGSERKMRRMMGDDTLPHVPRAHENLLELLVTLAGRHDPGDGKLSRFVPYFIEALRKVHLRDFQATLITSKWLITQLVSEIIREARGLPPAENGPDLDITKGPSGDQQRLEGSESHGEGSTSRMPWEEPEEGQEAQEGGSGGHGQGPWQPPEVQASGEDRVKALEQMVERLGVSPKDLQERFDDFEESKYRNSYTERAAKAKAKQAIGASVKDAEALEENLERSTEAMKRIVSKVRNAAARNVVTRDEWILKEAYARVVFHDVGEADVSGEARELTLEDEDTVRRLRATFIRVMGRRKRTMDYAGSEIDIPAYIERRMTHVNVPVFKADGSGRGFKALILVDRSSSMAGARTANAERACRIINRALDFPFVETSVWGFQSSKSGQVDITRYDPGVEVFTTSKSRVRGRTPLHTAIRIAAKFLEDGNEVKQLFVISDGFPTFTSKGRSFSTKQLMNFVSSEVRRSRRKGINVTGIMIGTERGGKIDSEVSPWAMRRMFGPSKYWTLMAGRKLGQDLVRLVSRSFIDYLRAS